MYEFPKEETNTDKTLTNYHDSYDSEQNDYISSPIDDYQSTAAEEQRRWLDDFGWL